MNRIITCLGILYAFVGTAQLVLKSGITASTTTNSNSLFTNGKVAIGGNPSGSLPTTDPTFQLQVTGSAKIANNINGSETIQFSHTHNPGGSVIPATSSQTFSGGNLQLSGTYGAAAANPWSANYSYTGQQMNFGGAGLAFLYGSSNTNNPQLNFSSSSTTAQKFSIQSQGSQNSLALHTNGAERITILPSGNVGIGVSNPTVALDVAGHSHRMGNFGYYGDNNVSCLIFNGSPDYYSGAWGNASRQAGWMGKLAFVQADGSFRFINSGGPTTAGQFVSSGGTLPMILTGHGRLGLGVENPEDRLHVSTLGSQARFDVSSEGTTSATPNRILLGQHNKTAISFVPWAPNNAWMHIHHTLSNAIMISQGGMAGENPLATFKANGQVVIGTKSPNNNAYNDQDAKLMVVGKIVAKEVVTLSDDASWKNFPDYVFEKDYKLMSLDSLQGYITANKHLPEIPSAKEVAENGINLSQLAAQQMKKIEELTLYLLEQQKQIDGLRRELDQLKK